MHVIAVFLTFKSDLQHVLPPPALQTGPLCFVSNIEVDKYFCKVEFVDLQGAVFFLWRGFVGCVTTLTLTNKIRFPIQTYRKKKQLTQKQMNHLIH